MNSEKHLLMVHGFLGNSLNWLPVKRLLEKAQADKILTGDWKFTAVDLLGHGKKYDLSAYSKFSIEEICLDLLNEVPKTPFVAVGHSFGLRPLLRITEKLGYEKIIKTLIVEDSSPVLSDRGFEDLRTIFHELPEVYSSRLNAKETFQKVWGFESKMPGFLLTNIQEKNGLYSWKIDRKKMFKLLEDSRNQSMWEAWENYQGPIEMLMGSVSSFVPEERIKECVERRAGKVTRVQYIEGSGHWVHADQVELFTNALINLLKLH